MDLKTFIQGKVLLGPMAGVTDMAFRCVCKDMGADLTYTEMVSAKALQFKNKKTKKLLTIGETERPAGVQIFGNEPQVMADMAKEICEVYPNDICLIDINMGCPAPKITNNGEGSALMKTPKLAGDIIERIKQNIDKPLSVKIRKGFTKDTVNAIDFAKLCQDSGADMITVHGRTRDQFYSGQADWQIIADIKKALDIPVVGNGDIFTQNDAKAMFEKTGVDAVMVARGALGNPFLFRQIKAYLQTGQNLPPVIVKERMDTLLKQARLAIAQKGEHTAIVQMRKHSAWYIKGLKNAARIREQLVRINHLSQLEAIVERIVNTQ